MFAVSSIRSHSNATSKNHVDGKIGDTLVASFETGRLAEPYFFFRMSLNILIIGFGVTSLRFSRKKCDKFAYSYECKLFAVDSFTFFSFV